MQTSLTSTGIQLNAIPNMARNVPGLHLSCWEVLNVYTVIVNTHLGEKIGYTKSLPCLFFSRISVHEAENQSSWTNQGDIKIPKWSGYAHALAPTWRKDE